MPIHATGCNLENVALSWFTSALETCPIQGLRIKTVKVVSFFSTIKKKMASGLIYFSRMDTGAAVQRRETARKAACFLENVRIWITQ